MAFLEQGETRTRREREGREMAAAAELAEEAAAEADDEAVGENVETWSAEARAAAEAEQLEEFRRFEEWSRHRWLPVEFFPADGGSDESEALHDLVERAVRLQGAGPVHPADRFDWFVSAAERRDTRSHGLFDLPMPRAEAPEFLEPEEEMTDAHRARLAAGFVGEPSVDFMDLQMLRVLASYPDSDVDLAAASLVEAGLLLKPIPEWVVDLVAETLHRYGDDFGDRIGREELDARGRIVPVGAGEDTLPGIWRQARRELGIPETAPARVPARATSD